MGANAQTSVPAFTAGQVLTAAQVTQINTGIPVFASSTERDAAFGGTGEKTLAEGQMAYLEDTNATQYYDGSSWAAVAGGKILQVVSTAKTDTFSTSSTSYVAITGLTAAITPSSATSKILIIAQISGSGAIFFSRLSGGNAGTYVGDAAGSRVQSATQMSSGSTDADSATIVFLDSPATAASVTYGVEIRRGGVSSETLVVNGTQDATDNANRGRMASSITVMEVAA